MAKPIIVANWKNFPHSLPEARALLKSLSKKKALFAKTGFFIAPPAPYLELVSQSFARPASQDLPMETQAPQTGALSPEILKSFGVRLAILGHSERRALGESSQEVADKVKASLKAGITPLVCVGERSRDADGEYFSALEEQIIGSLAGLSKKEAEKIMVAYEPVWAIGKSAGEAIEPQDLSEALLFVKKVLSDRFGRKSAEKVPLLYGGSVEPRNARALLESGVSGFLVGHASLNAKAFQGIVEALFEK